MHRLLLLLLLSLLACRKSTLETGPETTPKKMTILALGDSYTRGEGIPPTQSFPVQLADSLQARGLPTANPRIIAQTGWRTDQLLGAIAQATDIADSTFDLVTLCIGVNNQFQNRPLATYKQEFEQLLQIALQRAGNRTDHVVVLSIPDWAYTPFGQNFSSNPAAVSQQIDQFNSEKKALADQYGVRFLNVTPISRQGLSDPTLVATDGLHPSAKQYALWVEEVMK